MNYLLALSFIILKLLFIKCEPQQLSVFSSAPNTNIQYTRINLEDGSFNISITSQNAFEILGITSYDGVNWYDMIAWTAPTFSPASFSDLEQGTIIFSSFFGGGQDAVAYNLQPLAFDNVTGEGYYAGWLKKNNQLVMMGWACYIDNSAFFFNHTSYIVDMTYSNSIVGALDQNSNTFFINYVSSEGKRNILTYNTFGTQGDVIEYPFTVDSASALTSQVYMFYSSVGEGGLFMVDCGNNMISLLSVQLDQSTTTASSKVIVSESNAAGKPTDGLPFVYVNQLDRYVYLLSKPTNATSYTITRVDLTNFQTFSVTTNDITTEYNFALYYY
ncbi:hypothetical protein DLAC_00846 [Tieghemostelium lacteum]|uniref:Uncharacterized protein n=1 Tax=Tieghemostelium lacteum TaxID=361077 RepID=A0A152A734_TIELA|nr:hypothetical protein DLAC_00846 [Tieghemostelium lacteum]|eukprot:KYR02048.1 hypothetical protein DLAC_00846 [Tieghemostelium lacteum]